MRFLRANCHQGPRRRTHYEAGYIVAIRSCDLEAKTPLAMQEVSIYPLGWHWFSPGANRAA